MDEIYILGDFCLKNREYTEKILKQLKGRKHLIIGNHDKSLRGLENYFESVSQIKEVKFTNNQFKFIDPDETFCVEMCHFPMLTWNRRPHGTCHLHAHCHGSLDGFNTMSKELRVDAGLDAAFNGYNFIEVEDLYNYFCGIRDAAGCKTFQEYQEWLMDNQGFRM
jgi:calcineurin-like phosphoesterase family protein